MDVREQSGVPENARWWAFVLNWPGPTGLGGTENEARAALVANLYKVAAHRRARGKAMPRPGTNVPIEFASTVRVNADPALLEAFIEKALGFKREDPVFVSDESSISDFGDDERIAEIRRNILEHFGLPTTEPEPVLIADILERIRSKHEA